MPRTNVCNSFYTLYAICRVEAISGYTLLDEKHFVDQRNQKTMAGISSQGAPPISPHLTLTTTVKISIPNVDIIIFSECRSIKTVKEQNKVAPLEESRFFLQIANGRIKISSNLKALFWFRTGTMLYLNHIAMEGNLLHALISHCIFAW